MTKIHVLRVSDVYGVDVSFRKIKSRSFKFNRKETILKTKSNFKAFIIEYFYSRFDLTKIKYFSYLPRLVRADFRKDDSCK